MSITDELLRYAYSTFVYDDQKKRLVKIADRIDEEHEQLMAEQFDSLTSDMEPMTDENMAEHGWVRLPVDADGIPIHIGDVMVNLRDDLEPHLHHTFKVYSIHYRDYKQVCALTEDGYPAILYRANECRHYHPDTWEKIIEDAMHCDQLLEEYDQEAAADVFDTLVERCKALAGDTE